MLKTIWPGDYDRKDLQPLYAKLYEKYQAADPDNLMFFEPGQFPDEIGIGPGIVFDTGFTAPPGGQYGSPYHVLNDHTYCCQLGTDVCKENNEPKPEDKDRCLKWHEKRIGKREKDAKKLGVPLLMSEFGACMAEDTCVTEVNQVADVSDEHLAGWAYWQFKVFEDLTTSAGTRSEGFYNFDGSIQVNKVRALSRTYVKAAQGTIEKMKFNTEEEDGQPAGTFTADIKVDTTVTAPTEIHTLLNGTPSAADPEAVISWYPNGVDIEVSDPTAEVSQDGNTVSVLVKDPAMDEQVITITVTPKAAENIEESS